MVWIIICPPRWFYDCWLISFLLFRVLSFPYQMLFLLYSQKWSVIGRMPYRIKTTLAAFWNGWLYFTSGQRDRGPNDPSPRKVVGSMYRTKLSLTWLCLLSNSSTKTLLALCSFIISMRLSDHKKNLVVETDISLNCVIFVLMEVLQHRIWRVQCFSLRCYDSRHCLVFKPKKWGKM